MTEPAHSSARAERKIPGLLLGETPQGWIFLRLKSVNATCLPFLAVGSCAVPHAGGSALVLVPHTWYLSQHCRGVRGQNFIYLNVGSQKSVFFTNAIFHCQK